MRERVWLAYPPAYLGSFRSASKSNMAVKMTTAFAFLKNSGCPIYPSHHPWECKLHEKGSSHAEGGERRRKACLSAFQRLVLHSAGSHPSGTCMPLSSHYVRSGAIKCQLPQIPGEARKGSHFEDRKPSEKRLVLRVPKPASVVTSQPSLAPRTLPLSLSRVHCSASDLPLACGPCR